MNNAKDTQQYSNSVHMESVPFQGELDTLLLLSWDPNNINLYP